MGSKNEFGIRDKKDDRLVCEQSGELGCSLAEIAGLYNTMKILETFMEGVLLIEPDVYIDPRGFFMETWNQQKYSDLPLPDKFVQDNLSFSQRGILRGLHFQNPQPQAKLVTVLRGEVFDVAVDLRVKSRTFGKWYGGWLSSENKRQIFIPEGFAHGFLVTSDEALFSYKCTGYYNPKSERTLLWNDPDIAIDWPLKDPLLSPKDKAGLSLKAITEANLFSLNSIRQ